MKGFLEKLNGTKNAYEHIHDDNTVSEATLKFRSMRNKYSKLIGSRALYTCKNTKESRVVYIVEVYSKFLIVEYKVSSAYYEEKVRTSINYSSLLCGDQRLEVE